MRKITVLAGLLMCLAVSNGMAANSIAVTGEAAREGSFGLAATLDGSTNPAYVQDNSPDSETIYRASFITNRNDIDMVTAANHIIFLARQENDGTPDTSTIKLTMGRFGNGNYFCRAFVMQDNGSFRFIGGLIITTFDVKIGIEWKASDAGQSNGFLRLYRNDVLKQEFTNVDNEDTRIDYVRLGAVTHIDATTSGTAFYDSFESYRTLSP